MHELILGGAKSGKSACAEGRAAAWMAQGGDALLLATALAGDEEMRQRIARHRQDRALRAPGLQTEEVGAALGAAILAHSQPQRLLVVDCLTLWLTQLMLPPPGVRPGDVQTETSALLQALHQAAGPVVLVSNEIGLGVMPMSREARACVDALGELHKAVARASARLTLMVAGHELKVKP